jgi:hypothetical protein
MTTTVQQVLTQAAAGIARTVTANAAYTIAYQRAEQLFYAVVHQRLGGLAVRDSAGRLLWPASQYAWQYAPPVVAAAHTLQDAKDSLEPVWADFTYIADHPSLYGIQPAQAQALRDARAVGTAAIAKATTNLQQFHSSAYWEYDPTTTGWFRAVFTAGPNHAEVMQNQNRENAGSMLDQILSAWDPSLVRSDPATPPGGGGGWGDVPDVIKIVLGLGVGVVGALVLVKVLNQRAE